jgi:hypothetical protein
MSTYSLKELGILFGPEPKMQEYGLAFYAANCMNNEFLSAANTKQDPAQLKNCGVYQLMRTANYNDASSYTDQNAVHPTFVRFIEVLGYWHSLIDPQGVGKFDSATAKKAFDKLFDGASNANEVRILNDAIQRLGSAKASDIAQLVNTFFKVLKTDFKATDKLILDLAKGDTSINKGIQEIVMRNAAAQKTGDKTTAYKARFDIDVSDVTKTNDTTKFFLGTLNTVASELQKAYASKTPEVIDVVKHTIKILDLSSNAEIEDATKIIAKLKVFTDAYAAIDDWGLNGNEYKKKDNVNAAITAAQTFRINLNKIYSVDGGSITYFENIIPYLPKDVKVNDVKDPKVSSSQKPEYLRELYHNAYTNTDGKSIFVNDYKNLNTVAAGINFDEINLSKYVTNATESAFRDVSDKLSGTFKDDDIEVLVDLAAQKPGDLLYKLKNGNLVKMDDNPVAEVKSTDLAKGLADTGKVAEYMSRCILSDDSKGLETCLEYIANDSFFKDITPEEVHPTLAKEVLKKFKFGRHSRTNQPESYENWITRMKNDEKMKKILPIIEQNEKLVAYLKTMLKLVSDNLAIIGVPQKSTSVSGSNDPVVRNLEAKIPMYKNVSVGLNGTGEMASAEMMMRGNAFFNGGFSTAPYANAQRMIGGRRRRVQKGGAVTSNLTASTLENYFSTQISSLLRKNNVTLSTSDQETINGLLANLKKQELKVEKLINIIGVLNEIYSFAEKTGNLEKSMDIGAIIKANSRVIDYITTRKEEAQRCLRSTTNTTQNITDDLCTLTRDLTNQVFKQITNGNVNGDIILF